MVRFIALLVLVCVNAWGSAQTITIAAAVSLKETITSIGHDFQMRTGTPVEFAFGASGQLLAQIRSGAPVDAFLSAGSPQMDDLAKDGLMIENTRRDIVSNTLVLIAAPTSKLTSFNDLLSDSVRHIAIGEPKTVPAGAYGKQTLEYFQLFDPLQPKLLFGSNVRQVLDYVISGNADAGLVYGSDANEAGDRVRVITVAAEQSHQPIVYPAAVLRRSANSQRAKAFLDYLNGFEAQQTFAAHGFGPPAIRMSP